MIEFNEAPVPVDEWLPPDFQVRLRLYFGKNTRKIFQLITDKCVNNIFIVKKKQQSIVKEVMNKDDEDLLSEVRKNGALKGDQIFVRKGASICQTHFDMYVELLYVVE